MLAGRLPFAGEHDVAMLRAIADGVPPPLRSLRPDVPAPLESIVGKALQKEAKARYPSAREFLQDVEPLLAQSTATLPLRQVTRAERVLPSRRSLFGIAGVVVVLFAMGGWFMYRQARVRSAKQSLQQVSELVQKEEFSRAFMLLRQVERSEERRVGKECRL